MSSEDAIAEHLAARRRLGPNASRDELSRADRLRAALSDEALWSDPPEGSFDRIVAAMSSEQPPDIAIESPSEIGNHRPRAGTAERSDATVVSLRRRTPGRVTALVAAAAMIGIALGTAAGLTLGRDTVVEGSSPVQIAMAGTALSPAVTGRVEVSDTASGLEVRLWLEGLPPAPAGTYYQAWMKGDHGAVTIGTFHLREGTGEEAVVLWSGVELAAYPTITITRQREGDGAESSGDVYASGSILPG